MGSWEGLYNIRGSKRPLYTEQANGSGPTVVEPYGKLGRPYTGPLYTEQEKGSQANGLGPTVAELYGKLGRPL